jgi:FAD/FMN-containing dehydrogenase
MDPEWVVVSTSRMTAVEEFLQDNLSLRVQAGTTLSDIQAVADRAGAWLPASVERHGHRTIGGLLAEGAEGLEDFAWGPLRDHLLGIEFVSPQGELVASGGRTVKNVAGYDLAPLHWGSLGAFGLVTAVTLKLSPRLERRRLLLAEASGLEAALERAEALLHPPLGLLALRVMGAREADGPIRWRLAAQLGGATETLAAQVPLARRLLAPLPLQVLEEQAAADFWRAHFAAIKDSPPLHPLARSDRRTMLELLGGAGEALQGLDWSRLDLDLGCAALHLAAAGDDGQAAALATLVRHRPSGGRLWLGAAGAPEGALQRRLKQALDPQDRFAPQPLRRAYAVRR